MSSQCEICVEWEELFELQSKRVREATKLWQEATGRHDTFPDLGDLLTWLMDGRAELLATCELMVEAYGKPGCWDEISRNMVKLRGTIAKSKNLK